MHAVALEVDLRLRNVHSLKEKRRILKSLGSDIRSTFPVGFAETDHHDLWQRAQIGLAIVAPQAGHLDRMVHSIQRYLDDYGDTIEVLSIGVAHLEAPQ